MTWLPPLPSIAPVLCSLHLQTPLSLACEARPSTPGGLEAAARVTQSQEAPTWAGSVVRSKGLQCGCWGYVAAGSGGPARRGREGGARPGGGAEASAEACAVERREPRAAAAEAVPREGGRRGRAQRSALTIGSHRQDAPARRLLLRQPPPQPLAAGSQCRGAGTAAGAGGGSSELEPRAPECWVSAAAPAQGHQRGNPDGRTGQEGAASTWWDAGFVGMAVDSL